MTSASTAPATVQLKEHGQSVWLDYLSPGPARAGSSQRQLVDDAVIGITSNPTIFQKAISRGE